MDVTESRGGMAPTPPKEQAMNILTQRLPGLPVGLLRMMFGILWLQAALQKAPWVINAQGQHFGVSIPAVGFFGETEKFWALA